MELIELIKNEFQSFFSLGGVVELSPEEMMESFTSIFGLIYDIIENPKSIRILHSFSSHFLKRIALKYALILKAN